MATLFGMHFEGVTIVPDQSGVGAVFGYRFPDDSSALFCLTLEDLRLNERQLLTMLAGPVAEGRLTGRLDNNRRLGSLLAGHNSDYSRAHRLSCGILRLNPNVRTHSECAIIEAYVRFAERRVRCVFDDQCGAAWKAVDSLAAALMDRKMLSGDDARAIILSALFSDSAQLPVS